MRGHLPRKRFGQHFLIDDDIIRAIIAAIRPRPGDTLVEIGPGLEALTRPLLDCLPHLHVVEIDRDIIARLQRRYPPERLSVHAADALSFDFAALRVGSALKICGNLPYNISTPLLFHLDTYREHIIEMTFMLQKEVVERMVAAPATPDRGRLSVMLQRSWEMEALLDVPPDAFDPPPRVESAVVRMQPRAPDTRATLDDARFARIVATAFSQRRKTLRNTLGELFSAADFARAGIDPGLRAEALSVSDFETLASLPAT
jgi:16S rRNA (adenine1518-N6/adenine1519-N6)-dimethyltransferase